MERLRTILDGVRSYWDNLTERERRLMTVMGAVLGLLVVLLPVYFLSTSISSLEEENAELASALRQIGRSRSRIAAMRAEQAARDQRYEAGAPGEQWLPTQVSEHGLSFSRVQHEPERLVGRYRVATTRASFQGAGLRSAILLLTDLKNSRYPVAIERLHVDHNQAGDQYNLEVGVLTFQREGARAADAGTPAAERRPRARNTAGPPAP